MSYVARGEKIFAYQDPTYPNCSPGGFRRSDHRLKRFLSTFDRRAWDFCEEVRYRHLYDLISGSRTCLGIDQCHKYVPLEDLIRILMGEKDELIRQLKGDIGDKAKLQGQVAGLTEEVNKSRDMLRQAMHKLENIDEIVNENKKLQCRLRCSEERVKYLEEKRKKLESELADLRSRSQIQMDLERAQQMLSKVTQRREESTEMDEAVLQGLSAERNELQEKVKELENELKEAKKKEAEIEILKKQSHSDSLNREEMCRENECYRRKLASMKCLEKQIQELKKQGRALADKYKNESQKAAEQMKKMCQAAKEFQSIRDERDSLRKRVNELASYECQYNKLQRKLQRVDAVIAENEKLNAKLVALQKLEKENEYLKCRLEALQEVEVSAVDDKERIMQLQCAVADQEEEMKDLLCQIERLTSGKHEEELERLRCELYEKNCKLKLCEEQLAEIPMLEAEVDELRMKLQCCCREFPEAKREASSYQKVEVRFPASTGIRANYKIPGQKCSSVVGIRREEKIEVLKTSECSEKKEMMLCEEVQSLLRSSKGIISCVLEDMMEHQKEMEELEVCNRTMKEEIETLKAKVGTSDKDSLLGEICNLKRALEEKNAEVQRLQHQAGSSRDDEDANTLRELNAQMKAELQAACLGLKQVAELERKLEMEHKARCEAEDKLRRGKVVETAGEGGSTGRVVEAEVQVAGEVIEKRVEEQSAPGPPSSETAGKVVTEDPEFDCCKSLQKETDDLKLQIVALNTLTSELKKENELLRDLQQPCPDFSKELDEKCALENLLSLLQAELETFKGQKLSDECEALRKELKRVLEQNCQLKALVDCYRQRLDLEKKSNQLMQQATMTVEEPQPIPVAPGPPAAEMEEVERIQQAEAALKSKMDNCEQELKALRSSMAQMQQENENLKNSLKEADKKLSEKVDPSATGNAAEVAALQERLKQLEAENAEKLKKLEAEHAEKLKKLDAQTPDKSKNLEAENAERLKKLEAENAEKLKKLMEQHAKELANQEKKCNESLNAMKTGYETDIRKLTERHKMSVMRLQGLHEDEVHELNTNYETQLETMQTQSEEAMNDVARGSAAKLRKLAEKHAKEMKDMEGKLGELQGSLTQSMEELRKAQQNTAGDAAQLKAKHAREMQKVRRTSMQKMNTLKENFDEEKKQSQEEIEALKQKLKELEANAGACDCKSAKKKPPRPRDPTCPLDFNEVLEKILEQGLDALTFNEIALVHRKTCCALEGIMMSSKVCPALEPPVGDGCPHTPLLEADKQQLLSRIFALENDILQKQRQTQEAIVSMELAIKKERCRLQEVKNSLQNEQQKNSELKSLLSSQTKLETELKKERDKLGNQASLHQSLCEQKSYRRGPGKLLSNEDSHSNSNSVSSTNESCENLLTVVPRFGRQLDEEIKSRKDLEIEVEMLKSKLKQLCMNRNIDRGGSDCKQTNQVEVMRIKLEQSLNQERRLALQLENEAKYRMQLQCQLQALRQSFKQMVNLSAVENSGKLSQNPLEAKSVKERQNLDQIKEKKNKIKTKLGRKHRK